MARRQKLGKKGEEIAAEYLKDRGYRILARNYRCLYGEIDLIATDDQEVVFAEVKTRSSLQFGHPYESVTKRKQQRIRKIALHYLQETQPAIYNFRFDVISILVEGDKTFKIEVINNAF